MTDWHKRHVEQLTEAIWLEIDDEYPSGYNVALALRIIADAGIPDLGESLANILRDVADAIQQ